MVTAYIIQILLALITWAYIRLTHRWIADSYGVFSFLSSYLSGKPRSERGARYQERLKERKFTKAVVTTLTDFQKTQIFFTISVQISCIWSKSHLEELGTSSLQQWDNTDTFFAFISMASSLPMALTLITMRSADQRSRYVLLLSFIGSVMSCALLLVSERADIVHAEEIMAVNQGGTLSQCGYIASPQFWCREATTGDSVIPGPGHFDPYLLYYLSTLMVFIVISAQVFLAFKEESTAFILFAIKPLQNMLPRIHRKLVSFLATGKGGPSKFRRIIHVMSYPAEFILAFAITCQLITYFDFLGPGSDGVSGSTTWTLGQVISLTIWVPILVDFLHTAVCELIQLFITQRKYRDCANKSW